jgi:hypothetical protein
MTLLWSRQQDKESAKTLDSEKQHYRNTCREEHMYSKGTQQPSTLDAIPPDHESRFGAYHSMEKPLEILSHEVQQPPPCRTLQALCCMMGDEDTLATAVRFSVRLQFANTPH